jgi:hypothetical protein
MSFVLLDHSTQVLSLHLQGMELVYTHEALPTPQLHVYTTLVPSETFHVTLSVLPLLETTAKTNTVTTFYVTYIDS